MNTHVSNIEIDFIGVGAQRSATSWLYSCFSEHPAICAPEKEIHFFSRSRYKEKGIAWYKQIFSSHCDQSAVLGEFSTSYLSHPEAAARIKKHFPHTKILIALRQPADRAFSQYLLHGKVGWLDPSQVSFETFLKTEPSAKEQSLYYEQIKRFLDLFPRQQVHVILKEEIDATPEKVLHELFMFLGVDPDFKPALLHRVINSGNRPKRLWIDRTIQTISNWLYKHGWGEYVFMVKKSGLPALIRRSNSAGKVEKKQDSSMDALHEYFRADVEKTEQLIGKNLKSVWGY